jgi:hypothetical protein
LAKSVYRFLRTTSSARPSAAGAAAACADAHEIVYVWYLSAWRRTLQRLR